MSKPITLDRFITLMEEFMEALNLFNIRIDDLEKRIEKLEKEKG